MTVTIRFLGAARIATGSKYLIEHELHWPALVPEHDITWRI